MTISTIYLGSDGILVHEGRAGGSVSMSPSTGNAED